MSSEVKLACQKMALYVQYSLASLCYGKLWGCSFLRGKVTSPIQVAEVGKICLTRAFLKEIFAISNSGARGNCGKHLFRGKYIAINVTQILFLAESKLCSKSDSFQNVINLFHSSTTRKLVPNFKLWMYCNSICWGLDIGGVKDLTSIERPMTSFCDF